MAHKYAKSIILGSTGKIVCIMVGLPARGKTFIARKLARYLNWLGIQTQVFNVGDYRRVISGARRGHEFFDPANKEAEEERRRAAEVAFLELSEWLRETEGQVAVFDATNTSLARRRWLKESCDEAGFEALFIESVCDDEELEMENIREVKVGSPDYAEVDQAQAVADFKARIAHYRSIYQSVGEDEWEEASMTYVKLVNVGAKAIINQIQNYRQSRIVFYLMNLHIKPRSIYLCRHGETIYNQAGRIGGDAQLSEHGREFAKQLPGLLQRHLGDTTSLVVWTSTLQRTLQTVEHLPFPKVSWKALDEIDAGVCETLTYEEIAMQYPEDFAARDLDKFHYRYPNGESYADLVLRLEPVIMELERQDNILIVGHQAVLRAVLAYFMNKTHEELPYLKIPLHMVIKLTPKAYHCQVEFFQLDINAVDTHRSKPATPGSLS